MANQDKTKDSTEYPMPFERRSEFYRYLGSNGFRHEVCGINLYDQDNLCGVLLPWDATLHVKPGSRLETTVEEFLVQSSSESNPSEESTE